MASSTITDNGTKTESPALGLQIPENAAKRLLKAGIDLTTYPTRPQKPDFFDQVYAMRNEYRCDALPEFECMHPLYRK